MIITAISFFLPKCEQGNLALPHSGINVGRSPLRPTYALDLAARLSQFVGQFGHGLIQIRNQTVIG
ncbi:MAG: hypothetical protein J0H25_11860, partial [Rhizobiales bacterium]|nr:hypothetical protein [Hyphomicrobiales bacterium]